MVAWDKRVIGVSDLDKSYLAFGELLEKVGEGLGWVFVVHVASAGDRRYFNADSASTEDFRGNVDPFESKTASVLETATVVICSQVCCCF